MAKPTQIRYDNKINEQNLGMSAVVESRGLLFLSGIIALDDQMQPVAEGDMAGQIDFVYSKLEHVLSLYSVGLEEVVSETIFATDLAKIIEVASVRTAKYAHCVPPATTAVEVSKLFHPACMIELQAVAESPNYSGK